MKNCRICKIDKNDKVSQIHQTPNGWAFVITDTLHGDEYVCVAYPIRSTKFAAPNTADELLAMTKKDSVR